jgi:hypothetical protein
VDAIVGHVLTMAVHDVRPGDRADAKAAASHRSFAATHALALANAGLVGFCPGGV